MTSSINASVEVTGVATAKADINANWAAAKSEIEALQAGTGLGSNVVLNANLAAMAQSTIKGRASGGGTGSPQDLSVSQTQTILGLASSSTDTAIVKFSGTAGATQNSGVTIDGSNNVTLPSAAALNLGPNWAVAGGTIVSFTYGGNAMVKFDNTGSAAAVTITSPSTSTSHPDLDLVNTATTSLDGQGGFIRFYSNNSNLVSTQGAAINAGLVSSTAGNEQGDFDISLYRNGAIETVALSGPQGHSSTYGFWGPGSGQWILGQDNIGWLGLYINGSSSGTTLLNSDSTASYLQWGGAGLTAYTTHRLIDRDGSGSSGFIYNRVYAADGNVGAIFGGYSDPTDTYYGDQHIFKNRANNASGPVSVSTVTLNGATSGTLVVQTPAIAGTHTLTLPAGTTDFSSTGGSSQVVKQTSSGGAFTVAQLAFSDISGSVAAGQLPATPGLVSIQYFTSSGTYTPTSGTNFIVVVGVGGGGAGGGTQATSASQYAVGAGGGAGAFGQKKYTANFSGGTVTIASAATGVAGAAGNNGGACSFAPTSGTTLSCPGGTGGAVGVATSNVAAGVVAAPGGAGGTVATGGDLNSGGNPGGFGLMLPNWGGAPGGGAGSQFGGGGAGAGANAAGGAATGYGSGGGGAYALTGQSTIAGGDAPTGIIVIYEFR